MAMLALTAGQAFAQRCLPQMKGIEVKVGMADGVYNGKKSCKAGYYAGLGLSSYTKGGDKWTYGAEYLQVHQPYRETSVPMAQMTGEFGYSYNFLSDNSKTVLFYIGGTALAEQGSVYLWWCRGIGNGNLPVRCACSDRFRKGAVCMGQQHGTFPYAVWHRHEVHHQLKRKAYGHQ